MNNSDDYIIASAGFIILVSMLMFITFSIQGCSLMEEDKIIKMKIDCTECKVVYESNKEFKDDILKKGF